MDGFLQVILTSAAVSAGISSIIQQVGAYTERRERRHQADLDRNEKRKELLFKASTEAAARRVDTALSLKKTGIDVEVPAGIVDSARYYRWFSQLYQTGDLPADAFVEEQSAKAEIACAQAGAKADIAYKESLRSAQLMQQG